MKLKITIFLLILILTLASFTSIFEANQIFKKKDFLGEIIPIRVGIYTDEKETLDEFYAPQGRSRYFLYALSDYSWKAGNKHYVFVPEIISTQDIIKGELTKENYDVLLYTPCRGDESVFSTGFSNSPQNKIRVKNIKNFIESGGGYYATCGGTLPAGNMKNNPETFFELMRKRSCIGFSVTQYEYKMVNPTLCNYFGPDIQRIDTAAYILYSGWDQTDLDLNYHNGVCFNLPINHDNPIFDDLLEDKRLIRWQGGPYLEIPENVDRDIQVLAWYPEEEISDNSSTDIHYWKYAGGIRGLINAAFNGKGDLHYYENLGIFMRASVFSTDWKMINKTVKTNLSNKPAMTAEIYPNENKARILLTGLHPEYNVWWGGHIKEAQDNDKNNLFDGFYRWVNMTPQEETVEDEFSYNYWMVRRSVAWVSQKVDDNHMPPIYGNSEVCDFEKDTVGMNFNINGTAKKDDGTIFVDLFYRHSTDQVNWSEWKYYATDIVDYDDLSWDFNSPEGHGYYEFYSIRRVQNQGFISTETAPNGADAEIQVI